MIIVMKYTSLFYLFILCCGVVFGLENTRKLSVTGKDGKSYNLLGYTPFKNYDEIVDNLLIAKTRYSYNFALLFSNSTSSALLSHLTPIQIVFLELLHSFDEKNNSLVNFLSYVSNAMSSREYRSLSSFLKRNFVFPPDKIYEIIKFIANTNLTLPNTVSQQIFYLNLNYEVFNKAVDKNDVKVVKWLLAYGDWKEVNVDSSLIEEAWKKNKIEIVNLLMKYRKITSQNLPKKIINERYRNNLTLLHIASRNGYIDTVNLLIEDTSTNIDSKDIDQKTPLYRAVENNRSTVVRALLSRAKKIDVEPLLALGVKLGHVETVSELVEANVSLDIVDDNGDSPTLLALKSNDTKIFEALINVKRPNKEILNFTDESGNTLMHLAAAGGSLDYVKLLIKLGVPVNMKNNYGETPLHNAVSFQRFNVLKFLVESKNVPNINTETDVGNTILHLAASLGNIEIAQFLLSDKINFPLNGLNNLGETPINRAANSGKCDMLHFLVKKGGDIKIRNNGFTMLHSAAADGNEGAVVCLMNNGLDVDISGPWGVTPLSLAASQGHVRVVKTLLERNANPNSTTKNQWSPLHRAASNGHLEIIRLLQEYNAHINAENNEKLTPFYLAIKKAQVAVVDLIPKIFKNIIYKEPVQH